MGISKQAKKEYDRRRYKDNADAAKKRATEYRRKNKAKVRSANRLYYQNNKEAIMEKRKEYNHRPEVAARRRKTVNARHRALKIEVFTVYSGGVEPYCNCCGEKHPDFLTIDHINGDGASHRKELNIKGAKMYYWLKRAGYPTGYQVLCWNCNAAKGLFGECPHKGNENE